MMTNPLKNWIESWRKGAHFMIQLFRRHLVLLLGVWFLVVAVVPL